MRICYAPDGGPIGSPTAYYRCYFPFRELEKQGHWCKTPVYKPVEHEGKPSWMFDYTNWPEADVYVFGNPLHRSTADLMRLMRAQGRVVVGDADDSPFPAEWMDVWAGTHPLNDPNQNRDQRARGYQCATALTVTTPALAEQYQRWQKNTRILPNFLLWEMWGPAEQQSELERERVRVGWLGRSAWRKGDLDLLKPWLKPWLERNPNVDFVAAGDEKVHDLLGVPESQRVTLEPFVFPRKQVGTTASMDIGLVPLLLDEETRRFNEAKSDLKGLEYAACGIPCVASPSQQYREWVEPGANGFLAAGDADWVDALDVLVHDQDLRRRLGRCAREKAATRTVERHAHLWLDFYAELTERQGRLGGGKGLQGRPSRRRGDAVPLFERGAAAA